MGKKMLLILLLCSLGNVLLCNLLLCKFAYADDCEEMDAICTAPGGTKEFEGTNVYKPCWAYTYRLNCDKKSKNDCDKISEDCLFSKEECIDKININGTEICTNTRYTYSCEKESTYEKDAVALDENPTVDAKDLMCNMMCLDGNCSAIKKAALEENKELADAAGILNGVLDAKKDLEGDKLISVFKGNSEHCDKVITGALSCCKLKGWINGHLGFSCNANEKNLAKKRMEKKCVHIGQYCAEKVMPFGCVKKRTVYCCYDSIVAKIINQETKKQLGLNNGSPKSPNCVGITLEDLNKVDLSKADFKEFYDEVIAPSIKLPNVQADMQIHSSTNIINAPNKNGFNENFKHD